MGTIERLRAQLAPFILRRTKSQVATELPPKMEMELLCPLTDVQRAEYAKICAEGLERLGDVPRLWVPVATDPRRAAVDAALQRARSVDIEVVDPTWE